MALKLEVVTLADRAEIAEIITGANFDDPYGQAAWPNSTREGRCAGSYARLPMTMLGKRSWFMKVTENGKVISYAQWIIPSKALEQLKRENGGGIDRNVDKAMRKTFQEEHDASCDADGEPKGLNLELIEAATLGSDAAKHKAFPQNEDYIRPFLSPRSQRLRLIRSPVLQQLKTLPAHQRKGAGAMLMQWGIEFASHQKLKICLESTPYGFPLYSKLGFVPKGEFEFDASGFGGPKSYKWVMMVKEP